MEKTLLVKDIAVTPIDPKGFQSLRRKLSAYIRNEVSLSETEYTVAIKEIERLYNMYMHLIVESGARHAQPMDDMKSILSFSQASTHIAQVTCETTPIHTKLNSIKEYHEYWNAEHLVENRTKTLHTRDTFMNHLLTLLSHLGQKEYSIDGALDIMTSLFELAYFYPDNAEPSHMDFLWSEALQLGYELLFKRFFDNLYGNIARLKEHQTNPNIKYILYLLQNISSCHKTMIPLSEKITTMTEDMKTLAFASDSDPKDKKSTNEKTSKDKELQKSIGEHARMFKDYIYFSHDLIGTLTTLRQEAETKDMVNQLFNASNGFTGLFLVNWEGDEPISDLANIYAQDNETYAKYEKYIEQFNTSSLIQYLYALRSHIADTPWEQLDKAVQQNNKLPKFMKK